MDYFATDGPEQLMSDPSFLLSKEGLAMANESVEVGRHLIIPATFDAWLRESRQIDTERLVARDDVEASEERLGQLQALRADGLFRPFSYQEAGLQEGSREILDQVLELVDPLSTLWADEWAFLQSHSWLVSKLRHALDAFERAGAFVVEVGRDARQKLLEEVLPKEKIPEELTPQVLGTAAAKWVVLGAANPATGALVGLVVGGPLGLVAGSLAGAGAKAFTSKLLIAADP